jgi:hypothetical protein
MHPMWNDFDQAISIMLMATPFMFGVLTIFSLVILVLSKLKDPGEPAK